MFTVSIVVPAYNAASTLKKTIGDIQAQTYRDYELIIVDDGSTDDTPSISDEIMALDARVRVIHQENHGMSIARNIGTLAAKGSHVIYFDSDDRIEPCCLAYLVKALRESGADIACGLVDRVREDYELNGATAAFEYEVFDQNDAMSEMLTGRKLMVGTWCRLVPRAWMLEQPFLENKYYEDLSNTYRVNLMAEKVALVNCVLYHYVMRGGSITGRRQTTRKQCLDYYEAVNLCVDGTLAVYPELERDAAVLKMRDFMSLYLSIHRCTERDVQLDEIERRICEWMKKNWQHASSNAKAPRNVRLRSLLFGLSPWLYEKLYYIGIRVKGKAIS